MKRKFQKPIVKGAGICGATRKRCFHNEALAKNYADENKAKLRVYWCQFCGFHHLTSKL